jgi:hypothetical protein
LKEEAQDRTIWRNSRWKRLRTCRKTDYAMMVMEFVELQVSAALLLCMLDRNLGGSSALAYETAPARNQSAIIALINRSLQA